MPKSKTPPKLPGRNRAAAPRTGGAAARAAFAELADGGRLRTVALDRIAPNPQQPRRRFDDDALQGLVDSIGQRGVLQPPVVRAAGAGYELIAGERRCRAAQRAGLTELEVLVADCDDATALQDAVMENVVRQDLTPIEAARAYHTIIQDLGITREELGRRVGQSRVSISNHLRLLDLPEPALELIDAGELTFAHGRALLLCDDDHDRTSLARRAADECWSTRKLEDEARKAGAPRSRRPTGTSADADAFAARYADAISAQTGLELRARVNARGEVMVIAPDLQTARDLALKMGVSAAALEDPAPPC